MVEILHAYANERRIIDLGTGECMFEYMYRKHIPDAAVLSVEPFPQDHYYIDKDNVVKMQAQMMPIRAEELPVFIRPCHHWEFVGVALDNIKHSVSEALYISKPVNLEIDIPEEYTYKQMGEWEGEDGEHIYIIRLEGNPYQLENREFYMVKLPHWKEPIKMEKVNRDGVDWYVNSRGGGFFCSDKDIEATKIK